MTRFKCQINKIIFLPRRILGRSAKRELIVRLFQIRVCITTFLFISKFNNVSSIVILHNISVDMINRAVHATPFNYICHV
jgi:hypothetical protein